MAVSRNADDVSLSMPPCDHPQRTASWDETSPMHSNPELDVQERLLEETSKGDAKNTSDDVGRMLDAVSNSSKFSFKEGFYSESEADLGRHRRDWTDAEGYHRKEDFPHMRHLMALGGPRHRHRDSSTSRINSAKAIAQQTDSNLPLVNASSVPDALPSSSKQWDRDVDDNPEIVIHGPEMERKRNASQASKEETDGKKGSGGVRFFVGSDPISDERRLYMDSPVPSPKPSIMKQLPLAGGSRVPSAAGRVKFSVGSVSSLDEGSPRGRSGVDQQSPSSPPAGPTSLSRSSSRSRSHHKHKYVPSPAELAHRRHPGSESSTAAAAAGHKHLMLFDDDVTLPEVDLVGLTNSQNVNSHRFDKASGGGKKKRHSAAVMAATHNAMASIVQIGKPAPRSSTSSGSRWQDKFDHSPHDLFVELDELYLDEGGEAYEWREKSRWIKFEEDVEEGADRWGKPHVASLSFHSLLELRKVLEQGRIILDLEADDLPSIADRIVTELVVTKQLSVEQSALLLKTLLLKHRHVNERSRKLRRNVSYNNLQHLDSTNSGEHGTDKRHNESSLSKALSTGALRSWFHKKASASGELKKEGDKNGGGGGGTDLATVSSGDLHGSASTNVLEHEHKTSSLTANKRSAILHRIPLGAEATTVLVGEVEFLDKPVMAFVRLSKGQYLGQLTEVPLPVRFLFLLMGPAVMDYHEVGRSISTLMSNNHFHDMAYHADGRKDLLRAINEFLDDSLVLPPGEWGRSTLQPIIAMAKAKAKQRRAKAEQKRQEEEQPLTMTKSGGTEGAGGGDDDPLRRTGKLFGGLVQDIKRRYPKYLSDIKDGLNMQCLAAAVFIYFACLSPAITFGGLLGDKTNSWLGVSEVLLATSVCGGAFALFSGQPINIIGVTGPILVFEEALFQICNALSVEFLPFHLWVGVWVCIITLFMVAFDGSFLVRYISRFTEEVFASLISLIFIYEVFKKLYVIFTQHPLMDVYLPDDYIPLMSLNSNPNVTLNDTIQSLLDHYKISEEDFNRTGQDSAIDSRYQPNTALLSLILTFSTFFLAFFLKAFRNSKFLGRSARRAVGDFGIPISIILMVLVDFLITDTYTEKLSVPDGLKPTNESLRSWIVQPFGIDKALPIWAYFGAAIPAFLVFIIIFMESQITSIIVNKKERNLKKGPGYHLDLLLIGGFFPVLCGFLGLPLLCAATVRSVAHVSALTVFSRTHAPGEKPKLLAVHEQRVTSIIVHIFLGVSVLMGPILRLIPVAVLFGVFLYMGIASMSGIQLFERVKLMLMPVKHHPDVGYVRRVKTWKMNLFTFIQLLALAILWAIKSTAAALAFPFVLILMVPIRRYLFKYFFTRQELIALDTAEEGSDLARMDGDEEEGELDFYQQAHMPM